MSSEMLSLLKAGTIYTSVWWQHKSLYMNRSPHLQAVLTLGLDVAACSAKGPLALDRPREQPVE